MPPVERQPRLMMPLTLNLRHKLDISVLCFLAPTLRLQRLGLFFFLSCTHATAVVTVVMFHCSEWIHQLKNVLIIFIFYYTTTGPASCALANSLFPLNRL